MPIDRFKTQPDERLTENERKRAKKQAEPDMGEIRNSSDPADPFNTSMGWGMGDHGLGL